MTNRVVTVLFLTQTILIGFLSAQQSASVAYEKLSAIKSEGAPIMATNDEFNVQDPQSSQVMLSHLNCRSGQQPGTKAAHAVLTTLLNRHPAETFEWILDNYREMTPFGHAMLANSLAGFKYQESCRLLVLMQSDQNTVVDERAASVAPISPTRPYVHLRVCDYAFNSLVKTLKKDEKLPSDLPKRLSWDTSIIERDKAIEHLVEWWNHESARVLQQRATVTVNRPSIENKIQALKVK
jgi:hypothetical protein